MATAHNANMAISMVLGEVMPYETTADLPPAVKDHLPTHAQEIFLAAFNHSFEEYASHGDRESLAFRVAWAAVKKRYHKRGELWVEN